VRDPRVWGLPYDLVDKRLYLVHRNAKAAHFDCTALSQHPANVAPYETAT